ncbi:MAG: hypothetical protein AABX54_00225 [Nanoarchaeota archaeon]
MKKDLIRDVQEAWAEHVPRSHNHVYIFEMAKHEARICELNMDDGTIVREFKTEHDYFLEKTQSGRYSFPPETDRLRSYLVFKVRQQDASIQLYEIRLVA